MPNCLQNYVNIQFFFFFFFFFCSLAFIGNRYCFWGWNEKRKKVKHKNRREITNKTQTLRTWITSRQTMWIQRKEIMWHAARALSSLDLWLLCQQFDFPPTSPPPCRLWHLFSQARAARTVRTCSRKVALLIGRPVRRCYQFAANHWLVKITVINCLRRLFLPSRRVRFLTVIANLIEESIGKVYTIAFTWRQNWNCVRSAKG